MMNIRMTLLAMMLGMSSVLMLSTIALAKDEQSDLVVPYVNQDKQTRHLATPQQVNKHRSHSQSARVKKTVNKNSTDSVITTPQNSKPSADLPIDFDVPGKSFVSTGPYVGVPIQYTGSDLIINSPSINTDIQLLNIRKEMGEKIRKSFGHELQGMPTHAHLLLSGVAEAQAWYEQSSHGSYSSDIDLTTVSFDGFFIGPSQWTQGFIEFTYDNAPNTTNSYRESNSRLFVNKAFMTLGDLSQSPIYATFGQYYVPFGRYSSVMVSESLTKVLARTKARALTIGYYQTLEPGVVSASAYIFKGNSYAGSRSRINNGGVNAFYKMKINPSITAEIGGSIIANLADSGGMQGATGFSSQEQMVHRVPAYNVRGLLNIGEQWDILAEFVAAGKRFSARDMAFDTHGAKPSAYDVQAAYSFQLFDNKPTSLGIGYGHINEGLAMGVPESRYLLVLNTSWWHNTLQSIELRHDVQYGSHHTANGPQSGSSLLSSCTAASCTGLGGTDNVITAQFDYYF